MGLLSIDTATQDALQADESQGLYPDALTSVVALVGGHNYSAKSPGRGNVIVMLNRPQEHYMEMTIGNVTDEQVEPIRR